MCNIFEHISKMCNIFELSFSGTATAEDVRVQALCYICKAWDTGKDEDATHVPSLWGHSSPTCKFKGDHFWRPKRALPLCKGARTSCTGLSFRLPLLARLRSGQVTRKPKVGQLKVPPASDRDDTARAPHPSLLHRRILSENKGHLSKTWSRQSAHFPGQSQVVFNWNTDSDPASGSDMGQGTAWRESFYVLFRTGTLSLKPQGVEFHLYRPGKGFWEPPLFF